MAEKFNETALRYAKAIWAAEVASGNCSTDWPLTSSLEKRLLAAGAAAAGVFHGDFDGPITEAVRGEVGALRDTKHALGLFGNLGVGH